MKKYLSLLMLAMLTLFVACNGDDDDDKTVYTVSFETDGGTPVPATQRVEAGKTASEPSTNPTKEGYVFSYWHLRGNTTAYDFQTPVHSDISLYAKWVAEAVVETEGIYIGTTSYNGLREALDAAKGKTATIVVSNYQHGVPFSFSYTIPEDTHITIEGRGSFEQFLSSTSTGFTLNNDNSSLTLNNISVRRSTIKIVKGAFTMLDGAKIENNAKDDDNGGGVLMSGGTFVMKGGSITNNSVNAKSGYTRTGQGGGVHMSGGTFTMEGGEIYENTATYTGGLYIRGGDFIMKGGRIHSNVATHPDSNNNLSLYIYNDVPQGTAVYGDGSPILEEGSYGTSDDITGKQ